MGQVGYFLRYRRNLLLIVALAVGVWSLSGQAAAAPDGAPTELDAAFAAAGKVAQHGPADIKLAAQASLALPAGYIFVPAKEGNQLMRAMGNGAHDSLLGLVFPGDGHEGQWFVVVRYLPEGYIRDDDAKNWNADEMLQSIKDGTEEANKERSARGIPAIEVIGWAEKPHYDAASHQLVWAMSSRDKGSANAAPEGINYNTYALGREGYISMNLVTAYQTIEADKANATTLLSALHFNDGKGYGDFNASTDKVAAYGLAALVAGVAVKKLGLLAAAGVFLLKFWKLLALGAVGASAALSRVLGRKKTGGDSPPPAA
jgi:uncharacterized membrane-anchored protein